jgi:OPA family glycerol-3-phosphate transporter-like MFS transporter
MDPIQLEEFKKRRTWNWIILGTMYAFFYMSRYNFASAHPVLAEQLGWGYTDYGKILTPALIVYGLSVFFNGPLTDRIGGKTSILIGTVGACIANLAFGLTSLLINHPAKFTTAKVLISPALLNYGLTMSTLITFMAVIWCMNNYFQSFGALSVIKVNTKWFQVHERGRLAGFFSIPIQSGRFLGTIVCSALVYILPWQYIFWIPSIMLFIMFFIGKKYMYEAPEELGYQYFNTQTKEKEQIKISLVLKKVFANPTMWSIAALSMCLGVVRNSIDHWYARYFQVMFHIKASAIITFAPYKVVATCVPIVMILTGFIAGITSDKFFQGRRGPRSESVV